MSKPKRSLGARLALRAVALHQQLAPVPASEVLDLVFEPHRGRILEFDDWGVPGGDCLVEPTSGPFAMLVAEAFDSTRAPAEWVELATQRQAYDDGGLRVREEWTERVVCPFLQRYGFEP